MDSLYHPKDGGFDARFVRMVGHRGQQFVIAGVLSEIAGCAKSLRCKYRSAFERDERASRETCPRYGTLPAPLRIVSVVSHSCAPWIAERVTVSRPLNLKRESLYSISDDPNDFQP